MKFVALHSKGKFAQVDDADYELVSQFSWACLRSVKNREIYAQGHIAGSYILMGRFILGLQKGDPRVVRYKDHNPLNNQRDNMIITSRKRVSSNRRPNVKRTSEFKNVCYDRRGGYFPWHSSVPRGRKRNMYYASEKAAALAADLHYVRTAGGDAHMNFPNVGKARRFYVLDCERRMHGPRVFWSRHRRPCVFLHSSGNHYEVRVSSQYLGIYRREDFAEEAYIAKRNEIYKQMVEKAMKRSK